MGPRSRQDTETFESFETLSLASDCDYARSNPNVFTNGTTANAPEVNANFDALVAGVNDNDARIDALSSLFGVNTSMASAGTGAQCTLGAVWLTAGIIASGVPAEGQLLGIAENMSLFSLLGLTYGGNSPTSFALPDLRDAAPNGLTYVICIAGAFPVQS